MNLESVILIESHKYLKRLCKSYYYKKGQELRFCDLARSSMELEFCRPYNKELKKLKPSCHMPLVIAFATYKCIAF